MNFYKAEDFLKTQFITGYAEGASKVLASAPRRAASVASEKASKHSDLLNTPAVQVAAVVAALSSLLVMHFVPSLIPLFAVGLAVCSLGYALLRRG